MKTKNLKDKILTILFVVITFIVFYIFIWLGYILGI